MRGTGYAIAEIIGWMVATLGLGFVIGWISRGWSSDHDAAHWEAVARHEREQMLAIAAHIDIIEAPSEPASAIDGYIGDAGDDSLEPSEETGPDTEVAIAEPIHEVIFPEPDQSAEPPVEPAEPPDESAELQNENETPVAVADEPAMRPAEPEEAVVSTVGSDDGGSTEGKPASTELPPDEDETPAPVEDYPATGPPDPFESD